MMTMELNEHDENPDPVEPEPQQEKEQPGSTGKEFQTDISMRAHKVGAMSGMSFERSNIYFLGATKFDSGFPGQQQVFESKRISCSEYSVNGADFIASNSLNEKIDGLRVELEKRKILVLNCLDQEITHTIIVKISQHKSFRSFALHAVETHDRKKYTRDTFTRLKEIVNDSSDKKVPKSVLIINESNERDYNLDLPFLDFLMDHKPEVREQLKNTNLYFIYLVGSSIASERVSKDFYKVSFAYHTIEYTDYLLEHHFENDDVLVQETKKKIAKKRGNKTPEPTREMDFYKFLKNQLCYGKLEESLEEKSEETLQENEERMDMEFKDLFGSPIHKCILYVVIHFPGIDSADLVRLVGLLLKAKAPPISRESTPAEKAIELSDLEIWNADPDGALAACGLVVRSSPEGETFHFKDLDHQNYFLKKFENQIIYSQMMTEVVLRQGMFFSPVFSLRMLNVALPVAIQYFRKHNTTQRAELLYSWFFNGDTFITQDENTESPMCRILTILIKEEEFGQTLERFFDRIIGQEEHAEKTLRLLREFGLETSYNVFKKLLRFIDIQPTENGEQARQSIYLLAHSRLPECFGVYAAMSSALPPWKNMPSNRIPSQEFALLFIVNWFLHPSKIRREHWGKWPSEYPLFKSFCEEDKNTILKKYQLICQWLLRPELALAACENQQKVLLSKFAEELSSFLQHHDLSEASYKTKDAEDLVLLIENEYKISQIKPSATELYRLLVTSLFLRDLAENILYWYLILIGEKIQHASVSASNAQDALFEVIIANTDFRQRAILKWSWKQIMSDSSFDERIPARCIEELIQNFRTKERKK